MDMRIPPLKIKILLESNPLKSRILVRRLAGCIFEGHALSSYAFACAPPMATTTTTTNTTAATTTTTSTTMITIIITIILILIIVSSIMIIVTTIIIMSIMIEDAPLVTGEESTAMACRPRIHNSCEEFVRLARD